MVTTDIDETSLHLEVFGKKVPVAKVLPGIKITEVHQKKVGPGKISMKIQVKVEDKVEPEADRENPLLKTATGIMKIYSIQLMMENQWTIMKKY